MDNLLINAFIINGTSKIVNQSVFPDPVRRQFAFSLLLCYICPLISK